MLEAMLSRTGPESDLQQRRVRAWNQSVLGCASPAKCACHSDYVYPLPDGQSCAVFRPPATIANLSRFHRHNWTAGCLLYIQICCWYFWTEGLVCFCRLFWAVQDGVGTAGAALSNGLQAGVECEQDTAATLAASPGTWSQSQNVEAF